MAGAADRILVDVGFPYEGQVIFFRILALVLPVVVFIAVYYVCRELKASEARPLRRWYGTVVRRAPDGSYQEIPVEIDGGASDGNGRRPTEEERVGGDQPRGD